MVIWYLIIDVEYTVDHIDINGWMSDVYLKEVPNVAFNTVNFENVKI